MRLDLQLAGAPEVKKNLERLARLYPEALGAALYQEGMGVWRDAVKRAPVEFGVMRNSAYVSPPMRDGNDIATEIGFGTKYAVYQEQTEGLQHPRGGDAHYLRDAILEMQSGYLERLGKRTEQNVQAGIRAPVIAAPTRPKVGGSKKRRRLRRRKS